jgi:hypothetical protein
VRLRNRLSGPDEGNLHACVQIVILRRGVQLPRPPGPAARPAHLRRQAMTFKRFAFRRPTRRRLWIYTAGAAACLGVLALAADRATAWQVEDRAAGAFRAATGSASAPSVHVSGFPVITQVIAGRLGHVEVTAAELPATGSRPIPITALNLNLYGLRSYGQSNAARADTAQASAFISYADLSNALGPQITEDRQAGRIDATATVPLLGQVAVGARLAVDGADSIAFEDLSTHGDLPPGADGLIRQVLSQPIQLRGVPRGLRLVSVAADATGVHAQFTGTDVDFTTYSTSD